MLISSIFISKSKRLWILVGIAITTALILITISFVHIYNSKKQNSKNDLFNISSYYAKYTLNIVSNKNHNSYNIDEWYLKKEDGENFRIDFEDEQKNKMSYIISNNTLCLKNDNQIENINMENYDVKKKNLISIATFFDIYNKVFYNIKTDNIKIESKTVNDNNIYSIIFYDKDDEDSYENQYIDILRGGMQIHKLELVVDNDTKLPIEFLVYNKKNEIFIEIKYDKFDIINNFDEKIFAK